MADYPDNVWIREPVVDGRLVSGGGLNRAAALLQQMRDEITAIQTKVGTDIRGTSGDKAASLAARIGKRASASGLQRGKVAVVQSANASPSSIENAVGWWNATQGDFIQFGFNGTFTSSPQTITYNRVYTTTAPYFILAFYSAYNISNDRVGQVQVMYDTIGLNNFKVRAKEITAAGGWVDAVTNWSVVWCAMGGV